MATINITQALCLTLVHSLWQGFLAAVAAGFIIVCTRKSKAAVRYNLLIADLLLFVLAAAYTFIYELGGSGRVGGVSTWVAGKVSGLGETAALNGIRMEVHAGMERSTGILEQVGDFLTLHASTVVLIWMLCLLGQLVQLMGGLYRVGRLRRRRIFDPGPLWQEQLQVLAHRLGIRKTVALIQSAQVSVPVTFGFLKPSILVPLGMLTNLPANQVETILLHELAHIRRNDYLANLVLHITEAVFFFNPGLRWLASLIREEREACCDDMVVNTADRNSYFDALVAFQKNALVLQGYALSLAKGKTDLLWRIRRMLNQENKKLHIMEKAILSVGLTAVLAIGLISMRAAEQQAAKRQAGERQVARQPAWQGTDTLPAASDVVGMRSKVQFPTISTRVEDNGSVKKYKIDATDADGNTFQLTRINGAVTELVINGKSIPETDFDQYLYIFEEIEGRNHGTTGEDVQQRLEEQQERQQELQERQQELQEQEQEKQQEKLEQDQERRQEAAEKQQEALEKQQEVAEQEMERKQEAAEKVAEQQQEVLEKQQEAAEKKQEAAEQEAERKQEALDKQQEAAEQQEENSYVADRAIRQVISDMIDLGLVRSREDVHSFTLDNNGLILNGAQAPADAYQTLRRKYIRNAVEHYVYLHNGGSTTVDVKQDRQ